MGVSADGDGCPDVNHVGFAHEYFFGLSWLSVTFSQMALTSFSGMISSFSKAER